MKYLSLCSGVEAATVAWESLGWQAIAFAEYDAFPSAALAHHYPDVLNLGDLTLVTEQQIKDLQPMDLVVAGTPCQDLSVAGKGAGLDGERSGLYRTALTIFSWCRKHHETRFFLWENVPGAYSSNKGRDFAEVVKSMAGLDDLDVPKYGWGKEGAAVGDNGMLEWACLDAQFFGLAQRRKRVFAILDTGDWASRPPILLERESVRGDTPPSRETWEEATSNAGIGTEGSEFIGGVDGENNGFAPDKVCGPLMAGSPSGGGRPLPAIAYAIKGTAIGRQAHNGGNGLGVEEELCPTLTVADRHGVVHGTQDPITSDIAHCLGRNNGMENVLYSSDEVSKTLLAKSHSSHAVDKESYVVTTGSHWDSPSLAHPTLNQSNNTGGIAMSNQELFSQRGAGLVVGHRMEAFGQYTDDQTASTMKARDYKDATDLITDSSRVRRLTEIECERLQGFPDNYTNIPFTGKSIMGHRYKALGNSMAVPVMRYIGQQIDAALTQTHHPIQAKQEQPMQAPKTLEELREAIQTPFRMYELAAAHKWSNEDKKNIGEWIRQLVTKGHAVRFNQEWPTNHQNAKKETILMKPQIGQTVIATAALKTAMDADLAIVFGHRPYKLLRRDSPLRKGGYLYCTHKRLDPDKHTANIWTALSRMVRLSDYAQYQGQQQFFYNEETSQYLIRTTLTKRQVEVWDSLDAAVEQEAEAPAAPAAPDPVAQGVRTACIQCEEVSFMTDADKITVGESIRFMCEGCRAART